LSEEKRLLKKTEAKKKARKRTRPPYRKAWAARVSKG